jgi:hypothetical protein
MNDRRIETAVLMKPRHRASENSVHAAVVHPAPPDAVIASEALATVEFPPFRPSKKPGLTRFGGVGRNLRPRRLTAKFHRLQKPATSCQGEPALGQDLRDDRRTSTGAAGIPRDLQHRLADRTAQLHDADSLPTEATSIRR